MSVWNLFKTYSASNSSNKVCVSTIASPLGNLIGVADEDVLYVVAFDDAKYMQKSLRLLCDDLKSICFIQSKNKILCKLQDQLEKYFEGRLKKFDLPIKTIGTAFQKEVWRCLQEIPYASTMTYGGFAKSIGRDASHARAVGSACGLNAHVIVIPCHRLVASGSAGGFSCGLDRKEWLLNHEKKFEK